MLLTHTSGLSAWYPLYARGEGAVAYRRTLSELEPEAAPGAAVLYSDLGILVLGEVLEAFFSAPIDRTFSQLVAAPSGSAVRYLPEDPLSCAATEADDATERRMAAEIGVAYAGFRSGVVRGHVHDGNAYRRGGVSAHAGLFGTAQEVWKLARAVARSRTRRVHARSHARALRSARSRVAGQPGCRVDPAGLVLSAGFRPHGIHGYLALDRSRPGANLRAADQPRASTGRHRE